MVLGHRYQIGYGLEENCKSSVLYYEEAALESIKYVENSYGLDVVERKKLSIGPHVLIDQMQLFDKGADKIYNDFIELLDLKSDYGSAESLAILGIQYVHGTKNIKRNFLKARECFERALKIDNAHIDANYYLGLINLLGLGTEIQMEKSLEYFSHAKNDSGALNAIGFIYFSAPDYFDTDPVQKYKYGSIYKNIKKAKDYFERSSQQGNVNALYNLGCISLSSAKNTTFSYSDAYNYFKQSAEKGHTLSAYNIAIMHFLGLGTFESC
jgi:TPR repeat protein